ncbi:alpha/beta hydrolase family protein [Haladaptatus paucihalophilus]|uniref:alpha/beta hydrolase family protein n=1 Tax=Haladaptatus paucihalophilus TaxID=367189 RepID=UPI0022832F14|nr:alpha/beta hydrolase family protein [Haladaptatus paucihalophilus]
MKPYCIDTAAEDDHERQDWRAHTEVDFQLPFYLLIPDEQDPPYPVAITLHGHGAGGRDVSVGRPETTEQRTQITDERRDIALHAIDWGYAVIVPAMRGLAELANRSDEALGYRTCHTLQLHAQLFGRSLVGDRVWDVTCLLDFIEERSDIDDDRILVTGHSSGGAVALFSAAIDERIDAVAISSYFCTFEESIAAIDHCECNYVPGIAELGEQYDIAGLIAPRPFVATNGVEDDIFPIEGTKRAFERLQSIYTAAGAPEQCTLYIGDGGHEYYPDGVWPFVDDHF